MAGGGFEPSDQLYANQWHLQKLGDIERIWAQYTGRGIHVGVYDSGVQYNHWDLDGNYDRSRHVVINGVVRDPFVDGSKAGDSDHGTACAGVIGADADGTGTVGVAFGCSLTGVNFSGSGGLIMQGLQTEGLRSMAGFDVTNLSLTLRTTAFGDNFLTPGQGTADAAAVKFVADTGRGGLGTAMVVAAANQWTEDGRAYFGDPNHFSLQNSRYTITVAAHSDTNVVSTYSNRGAALLVSAPSNGSLSDTVGLEGILTTDFLGQAGSSKTDLNTDFGGTSASAPITAGVVTLMYDANERLGWRDVQDILAVSARHIGSSLATPRTPIPDIEAYGWSVNTARNWNGGGMHFSEDYGFGAVDAYAAVRMSEVWSLFGPAKTSANERTVQTATSTANLGIPDANASGYGFATWQYTITNALDIDHVELQTRFTHSHFNDLQIVLTSPGGTQSFLYNTPGAQNWGRVIPDIADAGFSWAFTSNAFRGESVVGTWTIEVRDLVAGNTGRLDALQLRFFGDTPSANDVYHYTAEAVSLTALRPSRATVSDTDGGVDWLNFAAIAGDVTVDLRGASRIGATVVARIAAGTVIENAVTGDGDDVLQGNNAPNRLLGMRGSDVLRGEAGNDSLEGGTQGDHLDGGAGQDTLAGGLGVDVMIGGADNDLFLVDHLFDGVVEAANGGVDTVRSSVAFGLGAHVEHLVLAGTAGLAGTGNELANRLVGTSGANRLDGGAGNDTLDGAAGGDLLLGGAGDDVLIVDHLGDRVTEGANGGVDRVQSAVSFSLAGQQIEALILTGAGLVDGTGNPLDNTLTGNVSANRLDGGAGADTVRGGGGNDTLTGGAGRDQLWGEGGSDVFDVNAVLESAVGIHRDVIQGWDGADRIDLSTIDAGPGAGDQAFTRVTGTADTSVGQGQVKVYQAGGSTFVVGNVTADGTADFQIEIVGLHSLGAVAFIL